MSPKPHAAKPVKPAPPPYRPPAAVFTIGLLLVLALSAGIRFRLLPVPLERDEGEYAYAGQLILKGVLPYQSPSLYKYKLPGTYFLYAVIEALFGQTISSIHFGLLLANIASIMILYFLTARLFNYLAALAAAAAFAILSLLDTVHGMFAHSEHFVVLTALAGTLLLLRAFDFSKVENSRSSAVFLRYYLYLFISALLFGTGYIIRQHGLAFCAFAGLFLFIALIKTRPFNLRRTIFSLALYAFGLAVPFIITCIIFAAAGLFDKFWFWTFTYAQKYLSLMPFHIGMNILKIAASAIFHSAPVLWVLAALGLLAAFLDKKYRPQLIFIILFIVFSIAAIIPGLYFREHYFIFLLPAAAILIALAVSSFFSLLSRIESPARVMAFSILLISLALAHTCYRQREIFFTLSPNDVSRAVYTFNPFLESIYIADYIAANSAPSDTVAILGSEPQILFYSKRISATGYTDTYELMKRHPFAVEMQKEMIAEIEASRPLFLVYVNVQPSWLITRDSPKDIFKWLDSYSARYYTRVGVVDINPTGQTRLIFNDSAKSYTPESQFFIYVLRRNP